MRTAVDPGSPSGAPIAVPRERDEQVARSRIDGYHQLDEETFASLLDEVGPRGLGTTVVSLLAASTAATFALGWLVYGLPTVTLVVVLLFLAGGTWGSYGIDRRRRRRLVVEAALARNFSERFAVRLARDLELMKGWLPPEERPGPLASWPTEKEALVRALQRVREP